MEWKRVDQELPIIPNNKCSVSVLVCTYDPIYDEDETDTTKSRGKGLRVSTFVSYGKYREYGCTQFGFHELCGDDWISCSEQITHWMYLPDPPKYDTVYNKQKDILEFIYK